MPVAGKVKSPTKAKNPAIPAKPDAPAARERARGKEHDGPLDSLGRAVTDTVTGSLPEDMPGSTSPDPDDPARR